jgi:hypothetical protein
MTGPDDFYELQITRRETPYVDPRPVLFCCAICEREIYHNKWQTEGRSRQIGPISPSDALARAALAKQVFNGVRLYVQASAFIGNAAKDVGGDAKVIEAKG